MAAGLKLGSLITCHVRLWPLLPGAAFPVQLGEVGEHGFFGIEDPAVESFRHVIGCWRVSGFSTLAPFVKRETAWVGV